MTKTNMTKILFIGNRQQDLGGFQQNTLQTNIIKSIEEICKSYQDKKITILTSLNIGIEMWAGITSAKLGIPYHVYVPFDNPQQKWPKIIQAQYLYVLKKSSKQIILDKGPFDYKKMIAKESRMMNDADIIHSYYSSVPPLLTAMAKAGKQVIDSLPTGEQDDIFVEI